MVIIVAIVKYLAAFKSSSRSNIKALFSLFFKIRIGYNTKSNNATLTNPIIRQNIVIEFSKEPGIQLTHLRI